MTFVPLIGFYDGVFGPGTGSFFMLGFVALAGFGVLRAYAHTKLLNFASIWEHSPFSPGPAPFVWL